MRYNTAAIRDLLNQALSDEEINTLCFDHFRDVYDNYFTASLNRHQKTHILIEQAERRGELERLLTAVREINPTQVTAFADQVLRLPSPPPRKNRRRLALTLGAALIVLILGGLLWARVLRSPTTPDLPSVITCQASPDPVRVAMQPLKDCPDDLVAELRAAWSASGAILAPITTGAEASMRTRRQPAGYDLIVSGACQVSASPVSLNLAFALSNIRNPDELYQPTEIRVSGVAGDVVSVGSALVSFQRGEYGRAGQQIAALRGGVKSRELELLRAGALLFEQRYEDAIEAYRALTRQEPDWSAALNNLGVARYNQSLLGTYASAGEDSLTDATDLAVARRESEIELLARVNRANVHRHAGNTDKAAADCQQAEKLNSQSQLTRICWLYYYTAIIGSDAARAVPVKAKVAEYLGTPQPDDIPRLVVIRGNWYRNQGRPGEATTAYTIFLQQMQFHACLAQDHEYLAAIPGQAKSLAP